MTIIGRIRAVMSDRPLTVAEVSSLTGVALQETRNALARMATAGEVTRVAIGTYAVRSIDCERYDSWTDRQRAADRRAEQLELSWLDLSCRAGWGL